MRASAAPLGTRQPLQCNSCSHAHTEAPARIAAAPDGPAPSRVIATDATAVQLLSQLPSPLSPLATRAAPRFTPDSEPFATLAAQLIRQSAGDASIQAHRIADRLVAQCHDFGCIDPRNFQLAVAAGDVPEGIAEAFGAAGDALHCAKRALDPSALSSVKYSCKFPPSGDAYARQRRVRARIEDASSLPDDPSDRLMIIADFYELLLSQFASDALTDVTIMQQGADTLMGAAIAEAERTAEATGSPEDVCGGEPTSPPPELPIPAPADATGLHKPVQQDDSDLAAS